MASYEGKQIPLEKLSLKKDCMTKNYPSKKLALENNSKILSDYEASMFLILI